MICLEHVDFSFPAKERVILKDFSLNVENGELLAIMGPSGCGKSTLLRLISGLIKPQTGTISVDSTRIAFVFQEPRLFPLLTVRENLRAVLDGEDAEERIEEALAFVRLTESASLYPAQLSGGMKMRVSLARAIAYRADLYLLDEPFSSLDEELRTALSDSLRERFRQDGSTAILVTHQQSDAERFADRVIPFPTI